MNEAKKKKLAELAEKIIDYRCSRGMNQTQFAELAGVTFVTISRIETCKTNVSKMTIAKIEKAINGGD
jgi:transcriptional regulator with XRE-family HTH domain